MLRRALLCACVGVMAAGAAAAETTRTLRAQLSGDPAAPFVVENLAGAMTVVAGDGDAVVAVATVHADDAALADAMRFEQVRNENGVPVLRVIYPLDRERTIRYEADGGDRHHGHRHHGLEWLFGSWDGTEVKYDGHRVRVSSSSGARLFADIEVRVPRRALSATFKNHVGELSAEGIEGRILLDTGRGGITARRLKGEIKADTGSGEVRIRRVKADLIVADTGSGRIVVEQADAGEFRGDTGSGGIDAELTGTRLRRVKADTGSGHVSLRIPADASFEVFADQGSGSLHCGFADATAVKDDHKTVGYRRGDGKVRIAIDTGSGGATVDPAR